MCFMINSLRQNLECSKPTTAAQDSFTLSVPTGTRPDSVNTNLYTQHTITGVNVSIDNRVKTD
jgi:hypothetical protein